MRAAYYKGVRLWEALQEMPPWAQRTGSMDHEGVRQRNKKANPQSPNFERSIKVRCVVEERSENAVAGYRTGVSIENTLLDVEDRLRDVATSDGWLAYCDEHTKQAAVSGNETAGSNVEVAIGATGGGWVPAAGELVLFRNPVSNAGFVTTILSVGAGTIFADLEEALTSSWDVVRVDRAFPDCVYVSMDGGAARDESDPELDRKEVTYTFACYGDPLIPSASFLDHDTT